MGCVRCSVLQCTHVHESCRAHKWVMSHIWMSHGAHMNKSRCTHEWVMSHTWTSHVTYMHESCRAHEWAMSHTCMSHVAHMNESCRIYKCLKRQYRVKICGRITCKEEQFFHVTHMHESCRTRVWVMSHIWTSHVAHMEWLRSVGSIKL